MTEDSQTPSPEPVSLEPPFDEAESHHNLSGDEQTNQGLSFEEVFTRLHFRPPTEEDQQRLERLREALDATNTDIRWPLILTLDYYQNLSETFPARIQALANAVIAAFNTMETTISEHHERFANDVPDRLATATRTALHEGLTEVGSQLGELTMFARNGTGRDAITKSLRDEVATEVRRLGEELRGEASSSIARVGDEARRTISQTIPQVSVRYLWIGTIVCVVLIALVALAGMWSWSDHRFRDGYYIGVRDRVQLEQRFAEGLDRNVQDALDQRNRRLPQDQRLIIR
jgi:hypothetical protein